MPNGGPDNCSTCGFNRRNQGIWRNPSPDEQQLPFCEIRGLPVPIDHWTYCQNWHTRTRQPIGPAYASGLYEESYRRIPWHGAISPEQTGSGVCNGCGEAFDEGLSIMTVEGAPVVFCGNRHYLRWWKQQHRQEEAPMSGDLSDL